MVIICCDVTSGFWESLPGSRAAVSCNKLFVPLLVEEERQRICTLGAILEHHMSGYAM